MNKTPEQILSDLKNHQELQSLKLEKNMRGRRKLLSFLSSPDRTAYIRTIFKPYIQKQLLYTIIRTVTWTVGKAVIWLYLILLIFGSILDTVFPS